jgi:hypothetical protein
MKVALFDNYRRSTKRPTLAKKPNLKERSVFENTAALLTLRVITFGF